jgi:hypothetical protein
MQHPIYFCNIDINTCNISPKHLKHLKHIYNLTTCGFQPSSFIMTQHRAGERPISKICILATVIVAVAGRVTLLGELPLPERITARDHRRGKQ